MSVRPYYKRFPSDALSGMMDLTLEERGAYNTIIDLIYDRGGPIVHNERLLSGYMNCSVRKCRSVVNLLIEKGKIYIDEDGRISNKRTEKEIENQASESRKKAEYGAKGGRQKAENEPKTSRKRAENETKQTRMVDETPKKPNKNSENDLAKLKLSSSYPYSIVQNTLPNGNADLDPETLAKQVWDAGVDYLMTTGLSERRARGVIGSWRKGRGDGETLQLILHCQAKGVSDPVSYEKGVRRSKQSSDQAREEFLNRSYG